MAGTFYLTVAADAVLVRARFVGADKVGDVAGTVRPGETFFGRDYAWLLARAKETGMVTEAEARAGEQDDPREEAANA